ncbi:MAG: hypothetical protein M1308_11220 [Actinobacteria bacterium]|nr:hypothetical protein [Actinomycetota bacterium]
MNKKAKILISILLMTFAISFSISCTSSSATTGSTKDQPSTTAEGTTADAKTSTSTAEETTTTNSKEEAVNSNKKNIQKLIEEYFKGTVTKIEVSDDYSTLSIEYDTQWVLKDTIEKEMYDITRGCGNLTIIFNVDISATDKNNKKYYSYTSQENLQKVKDLELSYEDWLKIAIK